MSTRVRTGTRLSADYWRFWSATAVSNLGDGIRLGALPLLVTSITREPIAVATVTALTMLPWVVFGAVGGAIVDRTDRRRLIVRAQFARGLVMAALATAVALDRHELWMIYVAAFVVGLGEVLVDSAAQAAVPQLAGDDPDMLELANARLNTALLVTNEVVGAPRTKPAPGPV